MSASSSITPICVNSTEAARLIGISPRTLANWRCRGTGPRYTHLGNDPHSPVIYLYSDLEEYVHNRFKRNSQGR